MADQQFLEFIKQQPVEKWNLFRYEHPEEAIDLSGADLSQTNLGGINLIRADLRGADLSSADLWEASLNGAYLVEANLSNANLARADLSYADLSRADLSDAVLRTTVALSWRTTTLKPVWEQNWFQGSARRGVGLKRGGHLFQASDGHMRGLAQPVGVGLPVDASIGHPTGSPLGA